MMFKFYVYLIYYFKLLPFSSINGFVVYVLDNKIHDPIYEIYFHYSMTAASELER